MFPAPQSTFSVTIQELKNVADGYKALVISGPSDLQWIETVKKAKNALMKIRTSITSSWKAWREKSNEYNKNVLIIEKELLAQVVPTEKYLEDQLKDIEHQQFLEAQKPKLKDRLASCERYHIPVEKPEDLLTMSDDQFHQFVIEGQAARLRSLEPEQQTQQPNTSKRVELRAYRDWLESNDYNPDTHFLSEDTHSCTLWKKVSTFNFPND